MNDLDQGRPKGTPIEADEMQVHVRVEDLLPDFALRLFRIFLKANWVVLSFIAVSYLVDTSLIAFGKMEPKYRLINDKVILALISATVIQVGSMVAVIITALLKSRPK